MSPEVSNMQIRIIAKDEATPVLRRIRREVWWMDHGAAVIGWVTGAIIFGGGLLVGLIVR